MCDFVTHVLGRNCLDKRTSNSGCDAERSESGRMVILRIWNNDKRNAKWNEQVEGRMQIRCTQSCLPLPYCTAPTTQARILRLSVRITHRSCRRPLKPRIGSSNNKNAHATTTRNSTSWKALDGLDGLLGRRTAFQWYSVQGCSCCFCSRCECNYVG